MNNRFIEKMLSILLACAMLLPLCGGFISTAAAITEDISQEDTALQQMLWENVCQAANHSGEALTVAATKPLSDFAGNQYYVI